MNEEEDVYLSLAAVAKRFGDLNPRTVKRWLLDPDLGFPKPLVVGKRRFFKLKELEKWEKKQRKP